MLDMAANTLISSDEQSTGHLVSFKLRKKLCLKTQERRLGTQSHPQPESKEQLLAADREMVFSNSVATVKLIML